MVQMRMSIFKGYQLLESIFMNFTTVKIIRSDPAMLHDSFRCFFAVFLALVVFLAQAIPANAGHGSTGSGAWIEICSDGGTYLAQLDDDGSGQAPECLHCEFCLASSGDAPTLGASAGLAPQTLELSLVSYFSEAGILPVSPEQYWSACRGPPLASVEKNMPIPILVEMVSMHRSTPCV